MLCERLIVLPVCLLQYLPSTAVNTSIQLQELRAQMLPLNVSAYIIPGTDAHLVHLPAVIINPSGFKILFCFCVVLICSLFLFCLFCQSEYIAPRDARMAFMTGFTGSAGTILLLLLFVLLHIRAPLLSSHILTNSSFILFSALSPAV